MNFGDWQRRSIDGQLVALSNEFPGFYRYALIMEEASEAERNKASRPYDSMAQFPEQYKQRGFCCNKLK